MATDMDDVVDETIEDTTDEGDSALLKSLRKQVKDQAREIKEKDTRLETVVDEALAQVAREQEVQRLIGEAGYPKMAEVIAEKVGGEVTAESVAAALEDLGLTPVQGGQANESQSSVSNLEAVANLGQQVASAAHGGGPRSLDTQLAEASNADQIAEIMAEAGLSTG